MKNLSSYEITAYHRLSKNKSDLFLAKTIVRFTNKKAVDFCLKNRDRLIKMKQFLKMNLRFYESLCSANEETLKECIKLKRNGLVEDYYMRNGFIKIIKKRVIDLLEYITLIFFTTTSADFYDHDI